MEEVDDALHLFWTRELFVSAEIREECLCHFGVCKPLRRSESETKGTCGRVDAYAFKRVKSEDNLMLDDLFV